MLYSIILLVYSLGSGFIYNFSSILRITTLHSCISFGNLITPPVSYSKPRGTPDISHSKLKGSVISVGMIVASRLSIFTLPLAVLR